MKNIFLFFKKILLFSKEILLFFKMILLFYFFLEDFTFFLGDFTFSQGDFTFFQDVVQSTYNLESNLLLRSWYIIKYSILYSSFKDRDKCRFYYPLKFQLAGNIASALSQDHGKQRHPHVHPVLSLTEVGSPWVGVNVDRDLLVPAVTLVSNTVVRQVSRHPLGASKTVNLSGVLT